MAVYTQCHASRAKGACDGFIHDPSPEYGGYRCQRCALPAAMHECQRRHEQRTTPYVRTIQMHVEFSGAVLRTRERNWHDDSDFYAIVWDREAKRLRTVDYATTRSGGTDDNFATIDATPDVIAAAGDWAAEQARPAIMADVAAAMREVTIGKRVRMTATRRGKNSPPAGTEGEVFWAGERRSQYGTWSYGTRYGFRADDGTTYFAAAGDLEVIDPEQYAPEWSTVERLVEGFRANPTAWVVARSAAAHGMVAL